MPKSVLEVTEQFGKSLTVEYSDMTVEVYEVEGSTHSIEAKITTPKTVLFSYGHSKKEIDQQRADIVTMFGNAEAMKNVASGAPVTAEAATTRFNERADRFMKHGNPFSAFTLENAEDGAFVGHMIAGGAGEHPISKAKLVGRSELAIVIDPAQQSKGHGTDAITALTYAWAPYLAKRDFKVNGSEDLVALWATAHPENGSARIFEANGYNALSTFDHPTYKAARTEYELSVAEAAEVVANTRTRFAV